MFLGGAKKNPLKTNIENYETFWSNFLPPPHLVKGFCNQKCRLLNILSKYHENVRKFFFKEILEPFLNPLFDLDVYSRAKILLYK